MKFNKQDATHADNLIRALKKGQFNLEGMEILAFAEMMRWVSNLHQIIIKSAQELEPSSMVPKEVKSPVTDAPVLLAPTKKLASRKEK